MAVITVSKENYLKAIFEAEAEGVNVIPATVAHWLDVTPPAVTMALRRLKRDGLISSWRDGRIRLTTQGRVVAQRLLSKHHLIERMLSEIFGLEWYKVHDEAERLEHAVSNDFQAKLLKRLGPHAVCPHGNDATPLNPTERRKRGLELLAQVPEGRGYVVASVYERDRKLLELFDRHGIRPGNRVKVLARNYDQTLSLSVGKTKFVLGSPAAAQVWVYTSQKTSAH
jgi:DtxR family Mn-dependent transcriptional regulator